MITPSTPDDLPALAEMLAALNGVHVLHRPDRFHGAADAAAREAFLADKLAGGGRILVYRTQGVPRGYLMWGTQVTADSPLERARAMAVLDHIYVEPTWRRRGLASRLIERFRQDIAAQGLSGWVARVHSFNAASLGLMQRHGAVPSVVMLEAQTPQSDSRSETIP